MIITFKNFLVENYNEKTSFYHITDDEMLDKLLDGIRVDLTKDWGQGKGFYVFKSKKRAEKLEGVGSRVVNVMIELEAVLNEKNFDIDYEMCYNLPDVVEKYIPLLYDKFKYNFILSGKDNNYLIFSNIDDKSNFYLKDKKFRNNIVTYVRSKNNEFFAYLPVDNNKLNFTQNIYGAVVTKDCMKLLNKIGIYKSIKLDIFNSENEYDIALRYIGPVIKPKRYRFKKNNIWGEWIPNEK